MNKHSMGIAVRGMLRFHRTRLLNTIVSPHTSAIYRLGPNRIGFGSVTRNCSRVVRRMSVEQFILGKNLTIARVLTSHT